MGFHIILPIVMGSVCATVALSEILMWARVKGRYSYLAFAFTCMAAAAYNFACAGGYSVQAAAQSVPWLKAEGVFINLCAFFFLWYLSGRTRLVPKSHLAVLGGWYGLSAVSQVVNYRNLNWMADLPVVMNVHLPFGLEVTYLQVEPGVLTKIQFIAGFGLFLYSFWIVARYFRAGRSGEAGSLLLVLAVICVAYFNDAAVNMKLYDFIFLLEFAWLAVVIFVGMNRSGQLVEAAHIKRALKESERRYRGIFESLQDVYFRTDAEGIVRLISPSVKAFGYEPAQILGKPVAEFVEGAGFDSGGAVSDVEVRVKSPDGRIFDASLNAHPVLGDHDALTGVEGTLRDISERKRAEQKLLASLQEKNVLIKEIHHRVKNNLQIISSLLYLQESRTSDLSLKEAVKDCRNRVLSMALIHEDLYRSRDLRSIDFGKYLTSFVGRLLNAFRLGKPVTFVHDTESISLDIDKAIPCGLIVNELCTNALKHAFPPGFEERDPQIRIECRRVGDGRIGIVFSDNGIGLPKDGEPLESGSLGMQIVSRLVGQLGGTILMKRGEGTGFIIEFPDS